MRSARRAIGRAAKPGANLGVQGAMKSILFLALGFALGMFVDRYELSKPAPGLTPATPGSSVRDSFDDKMRQWHLTPGEIDQDLAKSGEVVRTQAATVGARISDARIITEVKAKYVLDSDLSALDIHVSSRDGKVTLEGSASSPLLIGRAVALALDTSGVSDVSSKLVLSPH